MNIKIHARDLSFEHPRTKKLVAFSAPVPQDFKDALKFLKLKKKKVKG